MCSRRNYLKVISGGVNEKTYQKAASWLGHLHWRMNLDLGSDFDFICVARFQTEMDPSGGSSHAQGSTINPIGRRS